MAPDRPPDTADHAHPRAPFPPPDAEPAGEAPVARRVSEGMVAAAGDRWQAVAVRRFLSIAIFTVPLVAGSATPALAQAPAGTPGAPRTMSFSWTLYPRMWAEVDLRFATGAGAVAEITAEGGEVSWNLHAHPVESSFTPSAPGFYSYLFGNDRGSDLVRLRIELKLSGDVRLEGIKP
jgi:hypothetical protein